MERIGARVPHSFMKQKLLKPPLNAHCRATDSMNNAILKNRIGHASVAAVVILFEFGHLQK